MLRAYLRKLFAFVFCSRFTWRDAPGFLLGLAVPLIIWLASGASSESAHEIGSWEILAGIGLVVLLRAVVASYVMWRELTIYVSQLHRELDDKVNGV